mgnify:CR=1 FL=1
MTYGLKIMMKLRLKRLIYFTALWFLRAFLVFLILVLLLYFLTDGVSEIGGDAGVGVKNGTKIEQNSGFNEALPGSDWGGPSAPAE